MVRWEILIRDIEVFAYFLDTDTSYHFDVIMLTWTSDFTHTNFELQLFECFVCDLFDSIFDNVTLRHFFFPYIR